MNLTIEAIYLLHCYNEFSDDLAFLPLPNPDNLSRKQLLRQAVEKGYADLQDKGLILTGEVTDDCVRLGEYLRQYARSVYHYSIDNSYFVAPQVDQYKRMAVVLHKLEDGTYYLGRVTSVVLWGYIQESHKILYHLDDKIKDYAVFDWQPYSKLRLLIKHSESDVLRLTVQRFGRITEDILYHDIDHHLYEYDIKSEKRRAIDSEEFRELLIQKARVRL